MHGLNRQRRMLCLRKLVNKILGVELEKIRIVALRSRQNREELIKMDFTRGRLGDGLVLREVATRVTK